LAQECIDEIKEKSIVNVKKYKGLFNITSSRLASSIASSEDYFRQYACSLKQPSTVQGISILDIEDWVYFDWFETAWKYFYILKKSFSSNYLLGLLDEDGEKSSNSSLTSTVTDEQLDFLEKPVDMHLKESGSMASEFLYIKVSLNQTKDNIVNDFEAYIEKNHFSIKIADQEKDVKKKKLSKI